MFEFFINIYNFALYNPIKSLLMYFYNLTGGDLGLAIILLTVAFKTILIPFERKSLESQKALQEMQPEIDKISRECKDDKEKQAMAVMELYKKSDVNPFASIYLVLIQFPILIAMFQVIKSISLDDTLNKNFLNIISDLGANHNLPLIILIVVLQIIQMRKGTASSKKKNTFTKAMPYIFPVFIGFILYNFSAAIGIYILVSALFTVAQQFIINKDKKKHGGDKNKDKK